MNCSKTPCVFSSICTSDILLAPLILGYDSAMTSVFLVFVNVITILLCKSQTVVSKYKQPCGTRQTRGYYYKNWLVGTTLDRTYVDFLAIGYFFLS